MLKRVFLVFAVAATLSSKSCHSFDLKESLQKLQDSIRNHDADALNEFLDEILSCEAVDVFLKHAGLDLEQIHGRLLNVEDDPVKLVDAINKEIQYDVLKVENGSVRLDSNHIIRSIHTAIAKIVQLMFPQNYLMQILMQSEINRNINVHLSQFKEAIDKEAVPLDNLRESLFGSRQDIEKRDLYQNSVVQTFLNVIITLVKSQLSNFAVTARTFVDKGFNLVVNTLQSFITPQSGNIVEDVIVTVKNSAITQVVNITRSIQATLDGALDKIIAEGQIVLLHRRSSSNVALNTALVSVSSSPSVVSILLAPFKFIWNVIVSVFNWIITLVTHPLNAINSVFSGIWSTIKLIYNGIVSILKSLFGSLLDFLNCSAKKLVITLIDHLKQLLSSFLIDPIKVPIFNLIDMIIPCNNHCTLNVLKALS